MNDITALAQKIKASAIAVARDGRTDDEWFYYLQCVHHKNVLALVEALEKAQKSNQFLKDQLSELANFNPDWDKLEASYESWREIAAELLVAKDRIAELESRIVTVNPYPLATDKSQGWTIHPDFLHQIGERISDDEENYDSRPSMEMVEAVLLAAGGINAEGQAGTVTVKLPERYDVETHPLQSPKGEWYSRDDVLATLAAAGIQVIEGEA